MEELKEIKIKVYIDNCFKCTITCQNNINLKNLKEKIISKISASSTYLFKYEEDIINEEDELNISIADIDINTTKKVYLVSKNSDNKNILPIPGSIEKERLKDMIIYSYPTVKDLSEIEKVNKDITKNVLLIGKSGDGKTTFLNALINALLDIKGEEKIRYKLIFKESNKGQDKSQTPKITIYNIKINDKPILRLIDSPGFIDTEGRHKDEEYINEFKKFFREEISYINCICFVINSNSIRNTETQIELYNKISGLFSEEIKNNFVFIFTHYTYTGNNDARESLNQNEVFRNIINENNIFKIDSELAFTTDMIQRKYNWGRTSEEIQRLVNEKFFKLNPVDTAQSADIIEKRKDHQKLFYEKIDEFKNKTEEIKYLLEKESQLSDKEKILTFKTKKYIKENNEVENTNCERCHMTCHEDCQRRSFKNIRYFCRIFNFWGICRRCNCHFVRHHIANHRYVVKDEIINFKNEEEKEKFLDKEVEKLEKNIETSILDLNSIDKQILRDNDINLNASFNSFYGGKSLEEGESSIKKIIKYKILEAIRIVITIHESVSYLNRLALNKKIDKTVEDFFDEIKKLKDFEYMNDIIDKIKLEYVNLNKGEENKNKNIKFLILTDEDVKSENKLGASLNINLKSDYLMNID